jgi:glutamate-5-semialdehyde dehydrogenase
MAKQATSVQSQTSSTVEVARLAKLAASKLATMPGQARSQALNLIAYKLENASEKIYAANQIDLKEAEQLAKAGEIAHSALGRLKLDEAKLTQLVDGIRHLAQSDDPIGRETWGMQLDEGLELYRVNCPIGVIGVIFESRPDALPQIASLCVRTANACILKGGREAQHSNRQLFELISEALTEAGMPANSIALLETRAAVEELLQAHGLVDLIIPRGSNQLVSHIQNNTKIPVLGHAEGICHIYVDKAADLTKAERIIKDAKVQYPNACNAVETLLLHADVAPRLLPNLTAALMQCGVELRLDKAAIDLLPAASALHRAQESDWSTEYCDLILSIKIVNSLEEAIEHINRFGSHHTDSIITEDKATFEKFFAAVDSAGVFLNASTRFSDGYRYGFGAEVGISTGKLHPRGPVGLDGLITYKYKLVGNGHIVGDYVGPEAKSFAHRVIRTNREQTENY